MAETLTMPKLGFDMAEGTLVNWTKAVGDTVSKGDVIAEIETDKATIEIEAQAGGTLLKFLAEPGDVVEVGAPIAYVGAEGEQPPEDGSAPAAEAEAAPPPSEEEAEAVAAPEPPAAATIVAADGSQIYPNEQAPIHYFLLNLGALVYHYGSERTPDPFTQPRLFFHKDHVHDKYGRLIRNRTVDDRRNVAEIQFLAERAWEYRDEARPLVALYDNRLMFQPAGEHQENASFFRQYMGALVHLHDAGAVLAGYIDNPLRGERFIRLLYLLSLESEEQLRETQHGAPAGDLEGIRDAQFFRLILEPGERSAVMVQNSPRNLEFKERGENYEIAFFYLNVGSAFMPHIVRVDIPV